MSTVQQFLRIPYGPRARRRTDPWHPLTLVRRLANVWQHRSLALWVAVAVYAGADGIPSKAAHRPLAAIAVLSAALWTTWRMKRAQDRRARFLSDTIIALRRHAESFEHDATTDQLTELSNRAVFHSELKLALEACQTGTNTCMLLVDLNFFKEINDTWGHHVGDIALKHLARVLRRETSLEDAIARLGGDEFAVLIRDVELKDARHLAHRLSRAASANPVYRDPLGNEARISLSVGAVELATYADIDSALIAADRELYTAKARAHADRAAGRAAA